MNNGAENEMLIPKNVIIATGSRPKTLAGIEVDGKFVMTSDEALTMEAITKVDAYYWWWCNWGRMGIHVSGFWCRCNHIGVRRYHSFQRKIKKFRKKCNVY